MKLLNLDWCSLLDTLPAWGELQPATRKLLQLHGRPSANLDGLLFEGSLDELLEAGWLARLKKKTEKVRVTERYRMLLRVTRAAHRVPLFERADQPALSHYFREHMSNEQTNQLAGLPSTGALREVAVARVTSASWVTGFLGLAEPGAWEARLLKYGESSLFDLPHVFEDTSQLVGSLLEEGRPIPLEECARRSTKLSRKRLGPAIHAALRYALLYIGEDKATATPLIGAWPGVIERLRRPLAPAPERVEPEQTFYAALLAEDLLSLVVSCAAEPPRMLANGSGLYARDQRRLENDLAPAPDWLVAAAHEYAPSLGIQWRVERTLAVALWLGFVERQIRSERRHILATASGTSWLRLGASERLAELADGYRRENSSSYYWSALKRVRWNQELRQYHRDRERLEGTLFETFSRLEIDRFVELDAFLAYEAQCRNPLELDAPPLLWRRAAPNEEVRERIWANQLVVFLFERLGELGGLRWGISGNRLAFALAPPARYLLETTDELTYSATEQDAEIVVQPNFEVVFLAPAPAVEAAVGRFAERLEHGRVGTLFRITQASIYRAAAAGLLANEIVALLADSSSQPLPDNVEAEITAWSERCRRVSLRSAFLLDCGDIQTARRVIAAGGSHVRRLNETVVEIPHAQIKPAFRSKLAASGIYLDESSEE